MNRSVLFRTKLLGIMLSISLALLAVWSFTSIIQASSQQVEVWENMGIYGGLINDAVVDPTTERVYLSMSGYPGMYYSDDYGESWTGIEPGEPGAHNLLAASDGSIYAVFNELRQKESGGDTWDIVIDASIAPEAETISSFDVDPNDPEHIVVGTGSGVIYVSWVGGDEWLTSTISVPSGSSIAGLAIDTSDSSGHTVYAVNSHATDFNVTSSIYQSDDGGLTFAPIFSPPAGGQFFAVGVNISGTVFAAGTPGLYRSENDTEWSHVISDTELYFIDFDVENPATVYVDAHISEDYGLNWDEFDVHEFLAQSPINPEIIFTQSNLGIKRKFSEQAEWEEIVEGIEGIGIQDSISDPFDNQIIYVTSDYGVGITNDGGEGWDFPLAGIPGGRALAVDPNTSGTFYAGSANEVYKFRNHGMTWTNSTISEFPGLSQITEIVIDPSDNNRIYAASAGYSPALPGAYGGLFISEDGGSTWISSTLQGVPVQALIAVPTLNETLMVAGVGDPSGYSGSGGIYRSVDSGKNWTRVSMEDKIILALIAHPTNPDIMYAGSYYPASSPPVYISSDRGENWEPVGSMDCVEIFDIAIDPNDPDTLVVSCVNTIYKSVDGGDHWELYYEERPGGQIFTVQVPLLPPSPVSDFTAQPFSDNVRLEWTYPANIDLAGVQIRYLTDTFPSAHTTGISLTTLIGSEGSRGVFTHTGVVSETTYYYAAFAYDQSARYSIPAWVSATIPTVARFTSARSARLENFISQDNDQQGAVYISTSYGLYRRQGETADSYVLHLPLVNR